jgi:hypothetical protein
MAFDPEGNKIVVITGTYVHSTPRATLIKFPDVLENQWIPVSQNKLPAVEVEQGLWAMFVPKWLAEAKNTNWEEYDPEDWLDMQEDGVCNEPEPPEYDDWDNYDAD